MTFAILMAILLAFFVVGNAMPPYEATETLWKRRLTIILVVPCLAFIGVLFLVIGWLTFAVRVLVLDHGSEWPDYDHYCLRYEDFLWLWAEAKTYWSSAYRVSGDAK